MRNIICYRKGLYDVETLGYYCRSYHQQRSDFYFFHYSSVVLHYSRININKMTSLRFFLAFDITYSSPLRLKVSRIAIVIPAITR